MADNETSEERVHLEGISDGCGCVEVWERLSEQRGEGLPDEDGD